MAENVFPFLCSIAEVIPNIGLKKGKSNLPFCITVRIKPRKSAI